MILMILKMDVLKELKVVIGVKYYQKLEYSY